MFDNTYITYVRDFAVFEICGFFHLELLSFSISKILPFQNILKMFSKMYFTTYFYNSYFNSNIVLSSKKKKKMKFFLYKF